MSKNALEQDSVVSLAKARIDRVDARVDASLAHLKLQRANLDSAVAQLTQGILNLRDAPLPERSRDGVSHLLSELVDAKAELDRLAIALERIRRANAAP
jgi:hypothetical protein